MLSTSSTVIWAKYWISTFPSSWHSFIQVRDFIVAILVYSSFRLEVFLLVLHYIWYFLWIYLLRYCWLLSKCYVTLFVKNQFDRSSGVNWLEDLLYWATSFLWAISIDELMECETKLMYSMIFSICRRWYSTSSIWINNHADLDMNGGKLCSKIRLKLWFSAISLYDTRNISILLLDTDSGNQFNIFGQDINDDKQQN